ncbi:MAG: substrate-binding domain-containing protein [Prosthecobacter sp.]
MNPPIPQRISLVDQTVAALRQSLMQHEFTDRLPGESELAGRLHVSRNTVRAALTVLENEGCLRRANGVRREIVNLYPLPRTKVRRIILVMERTKNDFPPSTAQWIESLASRMSSEGWRFQIQVEPNTYRSRPAGILRSMTASLPGSIWVLHRSTPAMQQWFQDGAHKVILAGARHEGIHLPRVEADWRAASHHAAGRFLRRGHRRLAILRPDKALAGDEESVEAFKQAADSVPVMDIRCGGGAAGVVTALKSMLQLVHRPTGVYVLHADQCVTVLTFLQQQGFVVPAAISLICRDDESYLALLRPEPTRYRRSASVFAAKLGNLIRETEKGAAIKGKGHLIMPTAIEGATLASPPVLKKDR